MGLLSAADPQKSCFLGYCSAQLLQLFMLFVPFFLLVSLCLQFCANMSILATSFYQEISHKLMWMGQGEPRRGCCLPRIKSLTPLHDYIQNSVM